MHVCGVCMYVRMGYVCMCVRVYLSIAVCLCEARGKEQGCRARWDGVEGGGGTPSNVRGASTGRKDVSSCSTGSEQPV